MVSTGGRHRVNPFRMMLVVVFFASLYTHLFFGFEIPHPVPLACAVTLSLLNVRRLRKSVVKWLGLFIAISLLSVIFSVYSGYMVEKLRSFIYLLASSFAAYAIYLELRSWPRHDVANLCSASISILLIGCLLEMFVDPVRSVSDGFRLWNNPRSYSAEFRDISLHGGVRPKFFSREPSDVAKVISIFAVLWLGAARTRKKEIKFLLLMICVLLINRSATAFFLVPIFLVYFVFRNRVASEKSFVFLVVLVGVLIGLMLSVDYWAVGRIKNILEFTDQSFFIRLVGPFQLVPDLLSRSPLLGLGVGGTDAYVDSIILPFYADHGVAVDRFIVSGNAGALLNNALVDFVLFYGVGFGLVNFYILAKYFRALGVKSVAYVYFTALCFSVIIGSFVGLLFWVSVSACVLSCRYLEDDRAERGGIVGLRGQAGDAS